MNKHHKFALFLVFVFSFLSANAEPIEVFIIPHSHCGKCNILSSRRLSPTNDLFASSKMLAG
jgi:hypothetical protein